MKIPNLLTDKGENLNDNNGKVDEKLKQILKCLFKKHKKLKLDFDYSSSSKDVIANSKETTILIQSIRILAIEVLGTPNNLTIFKKDCFCQH